MPVVRRDDGIVIVAFYCLFGERRGGAGQGQDDLGFPLSSASRVYYYYCYIALLMCVFQTHFLSLTNRGKGRDVGVFVAIYGCGRGREEVR